MDHEVVPGLRRGAASLGAHLQRGVAGSEPLGHAPSISTPALENPRRPSTRETTDVAIELDHPFSTTKPIDESFAAITDLERVVPAVEGGSVIEKTGPDTAEAMHAVQMTKKVRVRCGRCSTVNVAVADEGDEAARSAGRPRP